MKVKTDLFSVTMHLGRCQKYAQSSDELCIFLSRVDCSFFQSSLNQYAHCMKANFLEPFI